MESVALIPDAEPEGILGPVLPKAKRRKVLEHESTFLEDLPSAQMYERSYMHRDNVTHVEVAQGSDFLITGSADGHVKFWKKQGKGVQFAKHFRAHLDAIAGLAVSHDSSYLASISTDPSVKIFDVKTLDMMAMLRLPFTPSCIEWIFKAGSSRTTLAVAEKDSPKIHVFDIRSPSSDALATFQNGHADPVVVMRYCPVHDTVISIDAKGIIDYWHGSDYKFPSDSVTFKFRIETDLFALAKAKTTASSLSISQQGNQFAVFCTDKKVRVFWLAKAKLRRVYDESSEAAEELQRAEGGLLKLEAIDFGKRMATERTLSSDETAPQPNAVFDSSGNFLIYPTMLGIKVVNLVANKVSRVIGKIENTERFLRIGLYQGGHKTGAIGKLGGPDSKLALTDPTIIALAYQRPRFFLFTKREPEDTDDIAQGRDVFNEKPAMEIMPTEDGGEEGVDNLPRGAIIHTTRGDISVRLHPVECPRTIENFATHSKNGYYNNVIFHRVIKGFMIQTGDPLGDGTGGTSIWGNEFADEFHRDLRHDRAFILSMANGGPNTNGSQFFITTVPTPWLDNKHTVFGRVLKGADVVQNIEKAKTNPKDDKPYEDIKIVNIEIRATAE